MDFTMIKMQLCMLMMLIVGFLCGKRGMLTAAGRSELTAVFTNIILPCNVLSAFCTHIPMSEIRQGSVIILAYAAVMLLSWGLAELLFFRIEIGQKRVLVYALITSNAHFLGFPVIQALWGERGILYASMALVPIIFFTWTIGLSQFAALDGKAGVRAVVTHPCFLALSAGFCLTLLQMDIPGPVAEVLTRFGNCVMPVSMLLIGTILSETDASHMLNWKTVVFSFLRLLAIPMTALLALNALGVAAEITRVIVIMVGMPAAVITAVLAEQYHADTRFASQLVFLSTISSLVTLPVLHYFCSV